MSRAMTWAIRVTLATGRAGFLRTRPGGVLGLGPIATFRTKAEADAKAASLRQELVGADVVTVIERSHGRQS